jgi:hypothetical protein
MGVDVQVPFFRWHWIEVNGQLHALFVLLLGENGRLDPESRSRRRRKEKMFCLCRNRILAVENVARRCTD